MTAPTALAERVAAGAAWLDDNQDEWTDRVDADRLEMLLADRCILGQVYGSYWYCPEIGGPFAAPADRDGALRVDEWAIAHGFQARQVRVGDPDDHVITDYDELNQAWRAELQRRRQTEQAAR